MFALTGKLVYKRDGRNSAPFAINTKLPCGSRTHPPKSFFEILFTFVKRYVIIMKTIWEVSLIRKILRSA